MQVFVVGRSTLDLKAVNSFLESEDLEWRRSDSATESEELVELAGRTCYLSFGERQSPRSNSAYIFNLIRSGHESVLEHVSWTFLITGISRALTHQLVRHRIGFSYSQLSQQYYEVDGTAMIVPAEIASHPKALAVWEESVEASRTAYHKILEILRELPSSVDLSKKEFLRGIRSAARSLLPNATETKIVVTANARALRHFLEIRGDIVGDEEMRRLAATLLEPLKMEAPALFDDFAIGKLADQSPIVHKLEASSKLSGERNVAIW
jgi:thymidylate synthase (FAD)